MKRESINFDALIVGGGPAGLSCAIKLMQMAKEKNREIEVALIEKGAEIGAHALSGAVLNPIALNSLIPNYKEKGCPIEADVRGDEFYLLTKDRAILSPQTPKYMHNKGFHIISLSKFTRWLAGIAEEMGVNIFPGFAGAEVLFKEDGKTIAGVRAGDKGIDKNGEQKPSFEAGIDLLAKVTVFAEGARGSLVQSIADKLMLFDPNMPQVFETGIKEVIEVGEINYFQNSKGNDIHTLGYPLGINTVGGGFLYQMQNNRISLGLIIGLCYEDCQLDIYEEFIKFKKHPFIANIIKGGKVIAQGARTVCTGGYYAMPKLVVDAGIFIGACAGMQNAPGLKGIHLSMQSGILGAQAIMGALSSGKDGFSQSALKLYNNLFENDWSKQEIYEGRNFAQAISKKGFTKFLHLGAQYFTRGKGIVDQMPLEADYKTLQPKSKSSIKYEKQKYDDTLYIDKLTGVFLSKTIHKEDQPCHIQIHDRELCVTTCYKTYNCPCVRFCPGGVYEIEAEENSAKPKLKVNFSNCLHCKTCEIKDPYQNIRWTCPEGGDGPGYSIL